MKSEYSTEIVCIAELKAKPEKREELLKALSELIPLSKGEDGCLRYELHESVDDKNVFVFVDRFKDQKAWDYHCTTEHAEKYFEKIFPELTESINYKIYKELIFKN